MCSGCSERVLEMRKLDLAITDNVREVPVLFIFFNRLHHAKQVFDVLRQVQPRQLFLAGDGPRIGRLSDAGGCRETRELALQVDWPCELRTRFLEHNLGCKLAVSSAISWFFEQVEDGIILEDDCVPNLSFFSFCAETLERYRDDERVMQVSGSNFLPVRRDGGASYYFSALNDIWGWATWRRAWRHYDLSMPDYPEFKKRRLLENYVGGRAIASWLESYFDDACRSDCSVWSSQWTYAMARQNGLTIVPSVNLVRNIGFDSAGTHSSGDSWRYYNAFAVEDIGALIHPRFILVDRGADKLRFDVIRKTDPRLFVWNCCRAAVGAFVPTGLRHLYKETRIFLNCTGLAICRLKRFLVDFVSQ